MKLSQVKIVDKEILVNTDNEYEKFAIGELKDVFFGWIRRTVDKGESLAVDPISIMTEDCGDSIKYRATMMVDSLVRCKDCKWYEPENHNCLDEMAYARVWNGDDYCSFGERKEDD